MDDWQYSVYCKILAGDQSPFSEADVPPLTRHQRSAHRRLAKANYCLIEGKLYQRVKFTEIAQLPLRPTDQMSAEPKVGIDFVLQKVKTPVWVPVVRASERHSWLQKAHDENAHQGRDATLKFLQKTVHWHGMKSDVSNHIRLCDLCQRTRTDYTVAPLEHIIPEKPFVRWQIDLTTVAGHTGVLLIVIDCFTKHVWFKWLPSKEAIGVTSFLLSIFKKEGQRPKIIQSDNGGEFISDVMNQIAAEFNIEIIHGRPYHPQSQGNVERVNKTIKAMLYKLIRSAKQQNRPYSIMQLTEQVVDIYNNSSHSSTGFTPLELQRPILTSPVQASTPREILAEQRLQLAGLFARAHEQLQRAAKKADRVHNKKYATKLRIFKVGDRVLYKIPKQLRKKGQPGYDCEAEVTAVHRNSRYSLKFITNSPPNANRTFHANEFKLYYEPEKPSDTDPEVPTQVARQGGDLEKADSAEPKSLQDEDSDLFEVNFDMVAGPNNNDLEHDHEHEHEHEKEVSNDFDQYSIDVSDEDVPSYLDEQLENIIDLSEESLDCGNNTNVITERTPETDSVSETDYQAYQPRPRQQILREPGISECRFFRELGSPPKK